MSNAPIASYSSWSLSRLSLVGSHLFHHGESSTRHSTVNVSPVEDYHLPESTGEALPSTAQQTTSHLYCWLTVSLSPGPQPGSTSIPGMLIWHTSEVNMLERGYYLLVGQLRMLENADKNPSRKQFLIKSTNNCWNCPEPLPKRRGQSHRLSGNTSVNRESFRSFTSCKAKKQKSLSCRTGHVSSNLPIQNA